MATDNEVRRKLLEARANPTITPPVTAPEEFQIPGDENEQPEQEKITVIAENIDNAVIVLSDLLNTTPPGDLGEILSTLLEQLMRVSEIVKNVKEGNITAPSGEKLPLKIPEGVTPEAFAYGYGGKKVPFRPTATAEQYG